MLPLLLLACVPRLPVQAPRPDHHAVILVSMDALRPVDLARAPTPVMDRLAAEGATAEGLVPPLPSLTFPSHWTLATGLWPEHHGLVHNRFTDPQTGDDFSMLSGEDNADPRWFSDEAIWTAAARQGRSVGVVSWVGVAAQPEERWRPWDPSFSWDDRVDLGLEWLDEGVELVMLYFEEPDHTGHRTGPTSPEVDQAIARLDQAMGRLVAGLEARGRLESTDLIVVSDHGMAEVLGSEPLPEVRYAFRGPVAGLLTEEPPALEHATCSRKEDLPERLHYAASERIPPVICLADPGWLLGTPAEHLPAATHGWDPAQEEMHGVFVGAGPHFQQGSRLRAVDNVHIHALLAWLLAIEPSPGDGDLRVWRPILE